jgi:hypothetical protein
VLWIRIRIDFGRLVADPGQGGQKKAHKNKKVKKFSCFEELDILF